MLGEKCEHQIDNTFSTLSSMAIAAVGTCSLPGVQSRMGPPGDPGLTLDLVHGPMNAALCHLQQDLQFYHVKAGVLSALQDAYALPSLNLRSQSAELL